jgi:hypothetical protein
MINRIKIKVSQALKNTKIQNNVRKYITFPTTAVLKWMVKKWCQGCENSNIHNVRCHEEKKN